MADSAPNTASKLKHWGTPHLKNWHNYGVLFIRLWRLLTTQLSFLGTCVQASTCREKDVHDPIPCEKGNQHKLFLESVVHAFLRDPPLNSTISFYICGTLASLLMHVFMWNSPYHFDDSFRMLKHWKLTKCSTVCCCTRSDGPTISFQ